MQDLIPLMSDYPELDYRIRRQSQHRLTHEQKMRALASVSDPDVNVDVDVEAADHATSQEHHPIFKEPTTVRSVVMMIIQHGCRADSTVVASSGCTMTSFFCRQSD